MGLFLNDSSPVNIVQLALGAIAAILLNILTLVPEFLTSITLSGVLI